MTEDELIARCRKHEIAYTALSPLARRELWMLTEQADQCGTAFLTERTLRLRENCHIDEGRFDKLYEALEQILTLVTDGVSAYLGTLGDTGRTVSFSMARSKLSAQSLAGLRALTNMISEQERALGLLCHQCYRELSNLASGEGACVTCRITAQLIKDAAVLCEFSDDDALITAMTAHEQFINACGQRRGKIQKRLEEVLALCERTIPEILIDFRGVTLRDETELTTMVLIRACEQTRSRLSSLRSLVFSQKHA